MGLLKNQTWFEDATPVSPPSQWEYSAHSLAVTFVSGKAAIFTGDVAFPIGTPMVLSAATMPGGFTAGKIYYTTASIAISPLAFGLSSTLGGAPIAATSAGATVVGRDARYIFSYLQTPDANCSLLLHMNGAAASPTFTDSSGYANVMSQDFSGPNMSVPTAGSAQLQTGTVKFGSAAGGFKVGNGFYAQVNTPFVAGDELDLSTSDFTIEVQAYTTNTGNAIMLSSYNTSSIGAWWLINNPGTSVLFVFYVGTTQYTLNMGVSGTGSIPLNSWHHIAVCRQGNVFNGFVDGLLVGTVTQAGPLAINSGRFYVGASPIGSSPCDFLDEVRVTKGLARYTAPFTAPVAAFNDPNMKLGQIGNIEYIGNALTSGGLQNGLFGTLRVGYQVIQPASDSLTLRYNVGAGNIDVPLSNVAGATGNVSICLDGASQLLIGFGPTDGSGTAVVALSEGVADTTYGNANFNCSCPEPDTFATLATLRDRLMRRLGFGAQVGNPPPGMQDLLTEFINSAQTSLYKRYPARFSRRFFRWTLQAGERFLGVKNNDDDSVRNLKADLSLGVIGSWIQDGKNTWTPIFEGIQPELYTMVTQLGRPVRYELRECLEIFPAADGPYYLWLKGQVALAPMVADGDQTTIDSEVVFLFALAAAKAHYAQPDATATQAMANTYLGELTASTHLNKKYIPGAHPVAPIVKPVMTSFQDGS